MGGGGCGEKLLVWERESLSRLAVWMSDGGIRLNGINNVRTRIILDQLLASLDRVSSVHRECPFAFFFFFWSSVKMLLSFGGIVCETKGKQHQNGQMGW